MLAGEDGVLALRLVAHGRALRRPVRVALAVEVPSVRVVADEERGVDRGAAERGLALGVREVDAEVLGVPRRAEIGGAVLNPEMVLHRGLIVCAHTIGPRAVQSSACP